MIESEPRKLLSPQEVIAEGFRELTTDPSIKERMSDIIGYLGGGIEIMQEAGRRIGVPEKELMPTIDKLLEASDFTAEEARFLTTARKIVEEKMKHDPHLFVPEGKTYTFSYTPNILQETHNGCDAVSLSAICKAIGIDVTEKDILAAGAEGGYVDETGMFFRNGLRLLITPSILQYIQKMRPNVREIRMEQCWGVTLQEITQVVNEFQDQGEDVYFIAGMSSELDPLALHSVIVESMGPDITVIQDHHAYTDGRLELPTNVFYKRFAYSNAQGDLILVIKRQN